MRLAAQKRIFDELKLQAATRARKAATALAIALGQDPKKKKKPLAAGAAGGMAAASSGGVAGTGDAAGETRLGVLHPWFAYIIMVLLRLRRRACRALLRERPLERHEGALRERRWVCAPN
jgi:hypothetical protein